MKKQAKFFCENCGEEVKQNARFCNKCGRFFSAVRCPACGKIGSSHAFTNGCPACGYADKPNKKTNLSNSLEKQSLKKKDQDYIEASVNIFKDVYINLLNFVEIIKINTDKNEIKIPSPNE